MQHAPDCAARIVQKQKEDDGSITFTFPKGYLFRGGIEDAPPEDEAEASASKARCCMPTSCKLCGHALYGARQRHAVRARWLTAAPCKLPCVWQSIFHTSVNAH